MDPSEYIAARVRNQTQSHAWKGGSIPEMTGWQAATRQRIRQLLGMGAFKPITRPHVSVDPPRRVKGGIRHSVRFTSGPGVEVCGYLILPDDARQSMPAMVCLPGHGRGVDSIVGIMPDGSDRADGADLEYQADFALQCAARGYVTLAIEQISFGHRRDARARLESIHESSCSRDCAGALALGETMMFWRIRDAMTAVSVLRNRPEVDRERIGLMGISGGGATAFWTACLDTRVWATFVSGYFNRFADSILAVNHCIDNFVPGIQTVIEMDDMAGLVAPRLLWAESGLDDPIFPAAGFLAATARASDIYAGLGASDSFGYEQFAGRHVFWGKGGFDWLDRRRSPRPAQPASP